MVWAVAARVAKSIVPKAVKVLRRTSAGNKLIGKLSSTTAGKIVQRSSAAAGGKALAAAKSTLGSGGSAAIGKVGTRMTSGISKMPRPMRWAADLTGVKSVAGGMARFGSPMTKLGKVKTAAMIGVGGFGLKQTYGFLKPSGKEPITGVDGGAEGGEVDTGQGDYRPENDDAGTGSPNPITGKGYGEYLKNPLVLGALGAAGIGIGAFALRKTIAKKVIGGAAKKVRGKKKGTKTTRKGTRTGTGAYTMKALAKKWKKLSKNTKAKYEGKFSDYIKVHREKGIAAKKTTTKRKPQRRNAAGKPRFGRRQTPAVKKQQNKMKQAAKAWRKYTGSMSYREFISKELKK